MRTYIKFKRSLGFEEYLNLKNEQHRKAMARFRISAHSLAIERGRYTRPPTPVDKQTCKHCPDFVEDEYHFLIHCSKYEIARNKLFCEITQNCRLFPHLNNYEKFIYMMSAEDKIADLVANFIFINMPKS